MELFYDPPGFASEIANVLRLIPKPPNVANHDESFFAKKTSARGDAQYSSCRSLASAGIPMVP
jgi:hypothetical protein